METLTVTLASRLSLPDVAGAGLAGSLLATVLLALLAGGVAGCESAAKARSRSILGNTSLPSTVRAGLMLTASEPEPLSPERLILKSLAAKDVGERSMLPSKLNLPASGAGRAGTGWPAAVINWA